MSANVALRIYKGGQLIAIKRFAQGVIKIGRLQTSHVCLDDGAVARMHAVIEAAGADVRVIDLGSASGTLVNHRRVAKSAAIHHGDVLEFGPYRVEVDVGEVLAISVRPARPGPVFDASDVEVQDGRQVTEVIARYGGTVQDVHHVGQVRNRRREAGPLLLAGGALLLAGGALLAADVSQDWDGYEQAVHRANARGGMEHPQTPGLGLGGLGIGLALLGLVPGVLGLIRLGDGGLEAYILGESPRATFPAPIAGLPDHDAFALVDARSGVPRLHFADEMVGEVSRDGRRLTLAELIASGAAVADGGAYAYPIVPGLRCRVAQGDVEFFINSVAPGRVTASRRAADASFWRYNGGALGVIGTLLLLVNLRPQDELTMDLEEYAADSRWVGHLSQPAQRPDPPADRTQEGSHDGAGTPGQRPTGEAGTMGTRTAQTEPRMYAIKGPRDAVPSLARTLDHEMQARQAGIIGIIGNMAAAQGGMITTGPGPFAQGHDDANLWGSLTGTQMGEVTGVGGVALAGIVRGGGGSATGTIGLDTIGTIGKLGGGGPVSGYAPDRRTGLGHRKARVPILPATSIKQQGRMDKDLIRRVIRSHINEVSHCYNQGLVRDDNLKGRVTIAFVIGPTGAVTAAAVAERSLKDASVAQCIVKAVRRWKFPKPDDGGNVMVHYPFVLETTA